ncbi:hypothetical protein SAMN02745866_01727 [Alteromonadaceae bacterium Bs31]|nr:hypothetical protein SAMN02745866_01727 [Alteromonadaceae bacterium Bs31]
MKASWIYTMVVVAPLFFHPFATASDIWGVNYRSEIKYIYSGQPDTYSIKEPSLSECQSTKKEKLNHLLNTEATDIISVTQCKRFDYLAGYLDDFIAKEWPHGFRIINPLFDDPVPLVSIDELPTTFLEHLNLLEEGYAISEMQERIIELRHEYHVEQFLQEVDELAKSYQE